MKYLVFTLGLLLVQNNQETGAIIAPDFKDFTTLIGSVGSSLKDASAISSFLDEKKMFKDAISLATKEFGTWPRLFQNKNPIESVQKIEDSGLRIIREMKSVCVATEDKTRLDCDVRFNIITDKLLLRSIENMTAIADEFPNSKLSETVTEYTLAKLMHMVSHSCRMMFFMAFRYARNELPSNIEEKAIAIVSKTFEAIEDVSKENNDTVIKLNITQFQSWAKFLEKNRKTILSINSSLTETLFIANRKFFDQQSKYKLNELSERNREIFLMVITEMHTGLSFAQAGIGSAVDVMVQKLLTTYYELGVSTNLLLTETTLNATLLFNHVLNEAYDEYFGYVLLRNNYNKAIAEMRKEEMALYKDLLGCGPVTIKRSQSDNDEIKEAFETAYKSFRDRSEDCRTESNEEDDVQFYTCLNECSDYALTVLNDFLEYKASQMINDGEHDQKVTRCAEQKVIQFFSTLDRLYDEYVVNSGIYNFDLEDIEDFILHM